MKSSKGCAHGLMQIQNPQKNFLDSKPILPISSVQFSSVAQSYPTPCDPMNRSTPGLPIHHQLLEFTQTHIHRVGDAIQPSHLLRPLLLLPPIPPSIRVYSNESTLRMMWPKYWSFSFSIIPSKEHLIIVAKNIKNLFHKSRLLNIHEAYLYASSFFSPMVNKVMKSFLIFSIVGRDNL